MSEPMVWDQRACRRGNRDGKGKELRIPWVPDGGWDLPVWVAGYGSQGAGTRRARADGFILQLADLQLLQWTVVPGSLAAAAAGWTCRR